MLFIVQHRVTKQHSLQVRKLALYVVMSSIAGINLIVPFRDQVGML